MKYINKFKTTDELETAIGENGSLSELEHYVAYNVSEDKILLKSLSQPKVKTMKFVFGENELNLINQIKESMPLPSWVLIGRKDLFKSIKYQGRDLLAARQTVAPIDWNKLSEQAGEQIEGYIKQITLFYHALVKVDTIQWNTDYVLTIHDVLGKDLPEIGEEILLEVEFKDDLTDLSAMHTFMSVGLTEISSNFFEDCTEVTNFEFAFDNSTLNQFFKTTYINPLKSSCPIDKDGTPLYERSNGKEGYAKVTVSDGCFMTCINMEDYNNLPITWRTGKITITKNKLTTNDILNERLPNNEYIQHNLNNYYNTINDAPYGFTIENDLGASNVGLSSINSIIFYNFDTSQVTDMSYMFSGCNSLTSLDLSSFDTSQVTDMSYMFLSCSLLTSLDLSNFDTSAVTDMTYMFSNCSSLNHIKCKQAFKDWCIDNKDTIKLLDTMINGSVGSDSSYNWEIID